MLNTSKRHYALSPRSKELYLSIFTKISITSALACGCLLGSAQAEPTPIGGGYSFDLTEQACQEEMTAELFGPDFASLGQSPFRVVILSLTRDKCPELRTLNIKGITAGEHVYSGSMKLENGWALESTQQDQSTSGQRPTIQLSTQTVQSGETIKVTIEGLPGNKTDWLTLVRANRPDTSYGDYHYTNGASSGTWEFKAPSAPGAYEVRVYYDEPAGGYVVHARAAIEVVSRQSAESTQQDQSTSGPRPTIQLSTQTVQSGETIKVTIEGLPGNKTDWLTLVRANRPDTSYGDYHYTNGASSGAWEFKAPSAPGAYEVRVYYDEPAGGYVVHARAPIEVVSRGSVSPESSGATVAPVAQSQASNLPFGEKNFIKALGSVARGPASQVDIFLKQRGYALVDARHVCVYQMDAGSVTRLVLADTTSRDCTAPDAQVARITATETLHQGLIPVTNEIAALETALAAKNVCTQATEYEANCRWDNPSTLPQVRYITVSLNSHPGVNSTVMRRYWLEPMTEHDDQLQMNNEDWKAHFERLEEWRKQANE